MLTRWAVRPKRKVEAAKVLRAKSLICAPISPETDPKLDWPTISDIKKSQTSSNQVPPNRFGLTEEVFKDSKDIIWIPSDDELLKLRIIIAAHTRHEGHRSQRVTLVSVRAHFFWQKMTEDMESFAQSCLHCFVYRIRKNRTSPTRTRSARRGTKQTTTFRFLFHVKRRKWICLRPSNET